MIVHHGGTENAEVAQRKPWSLLHSRVYSDPIQFPGLAAIIRKRLFKPARIGSDVRDDKSNKDGSTIQRFLVKELTASIFELSDCGYAQATATAARKIETPLARFGIVQAQVQAFEVTCRTIRGELHQIGAAIPNLSDYGRAFILNPGSRPG